MGEAAVEIVKPRTDTREYRRIVLRNSLEALLISDPDTDKAAASMSVSVGSFSDPEGFPGLAHFLGRPPKCREEGTHLQFHKESMSNGQRQGSFMGKWSICCFMPVKNIHWKTVTQSILQRSLLQEMELEDENIFSCIWIHPKDASSSEVHGGSTNAFTASEHTNYFFDVNTDCFEEALDRFAQFFVKPLMSADATTREIKAVDSENKKNLLSDAWRMDQLQKHVSAEGHPYHKFSTGNRDTLEVKPKEKGLDTRHELIKFYEEHYSANLMHLVVYTKESLDKIQSLVEHKFQEIQNKDRINFHICGQPCTSEHLQILVKTVPIKQGHKLIVVWPITPSIHNYKEGPCRYLGHLIGHEGKGSLFYILKTLGWATSLSAWEEDWTCEFSFFEVVIDLTDAGHEHMQDIVGLLFKYISLLQQTGVCKWIFDEVHVVGASMIEASNDKLLWERSFHCLR
ncbi:Insulin-degrading enzyme-like 1, peroxisomal [Vitis vinifera]|uniref:Insulin-degrading enzyme-like 1, peroxisomal n=1 Tax=Vitis vinifera TaxID=29760 RepID=A0A438JL69_VITVI|nr:Insulin-degrading enzyme-like 1, peroxisomal [Vitis vinifera]